MRGRHRMILRREKTILLGYGYASNRSGLFYDTGCFADGALIIEYHNVATLILLIIYQRQHIDVLEFGKGRGGQDSLHLTWRDRGLCRRESSGNRTYIG